MSRYISLGVLIAVILVLGIVFFRVMASFVLPLFLATVLVVVFAPVHQWVLEKTEKRKTLASAITTTIIGLAVLLPSASIGVFAFGEARELFKNLTAGGIEQNLKRIRKSLRLEMPAPTEFRQLEKKVRALDVRNVEELELGTLQLKRIEEAASQLAQQLGIDGESLSDRDVPPTRLLTVVDLGNWREFRASLQDALDRQQQLGELQARERQRDLDSKSNDASEEEQNDPDGESQQESIATKIDEEVPRPAVDELAEQRQAAEADYRQALDKIVSDFDKFRVEVLGGSFNAYLKEMANPSAEEFEKYNAAIIQWIRDHFLSLGGQATQFFIGIVFNVAIMMIGVYFFLVDGPKMILALKYLSPMDDEHEDELIHEFGIISRAVMVATVFSAIVQGALAGLGYYFAGVEAVFLLMMLTGLLAMVPFVGATAVWLPTSIYLYLMEDRLVPAALLAIWGAGVVSTIDNFIKPWILHGRSNIHPLLALLSVLGGVATLGPIGILVGPMVVAFLQTLLTILQREIKEMDRGGRESTTDNDCECDEAAESPPTAESVLAGAADEQGPADTSSSSGGFPIDNATESPASTSSDSDDGSDGEDPVPTDRG